ncbi:unnamed protein product, partial [Phaeothamnion confervicola]
RRKLRAFLRVRGEFPCQHRAAAWRLLLRLPYNVGAFRELAARGAHPAYARLHER